MLQVCNSQSGVRARGVSTCEARRAADTRYDPFGKVEVYTEKGAIRERQTGDFVCFDRFEFTLGSDVLARVRETNPSIYLRVIASLVPARLDVARTDEFADFDNMEIEELREYIATSFKADKTLLALITGEPATDSGDEKSSLPRQRTTRKNAGRS